MTDAKRALIALATERATLVISCSSDPSYEPFHVEVQYNAYLGGTHPVHYRIDHEEPVTGIWRQVFDGRRDTVSPAGDDAAKLVDGIKRGTRLVVQAETFQPAAVGEVAVFDLAGSAQALSRLNEACRAGQ